MSVFLNSNTLKVERLGCEGEHGHVRVLRGGLQDFTSPSALRRALIFS